MGLLETLKDRAEKVKTELDQEREKDRKLKEERERTLVHENAPMYQRMDVWCECCQKDYNVLMRKQGNELHAWYGSVCPKMHPVRREIALRDPYYLLSRKVRLESHIHADDMLTPADDRFRLIYPEKWRELERQREERETADKNV